MTSPTWQDRLAWITGASSGIGEALTRHLDARGARLLLSARREDTLNAVRASLDHPERHRILPLDLADADAVAEAARTVLADPGAPDVMLHNAGISQRSKAEDTALAVDREIFEVNFFGVVGLTKALLPAMLERGSGHFVVVSSLVGKIATPLRSGYSASKHALHGFFDALRAETFDRGIRVTLVCPGFIRTEISLHARTGDGSPQGTMDRAQERGMAPEECARRIVAAVEKRKREVWIGGKEVGAVYLHRFLPGFFHRMIRRARVT